MASNLRVKLPSITSLVARSKVTHTIGRDNKLPWHLGTDLRKFKERTEGHVIIMGRRTLDSIGRPLPRRTNIVLSRTKVDVPGFLWAGSHEDALFLADVHSIIKGKKEFFVIGGEAIYTLFQPCINKIFLTEVDDGGVEGDARFDADLNLEDWQRFRVDDYPSSERDEFGFSITCYLRYRQRLRVAFADKVRNWHPAIPDKIGSYIDDDLRSEDQRQLQF